MIVIAFNTHIAQQLLLLKQQERLHGFPSVCHRDIGYYSQCHAFPYTLRTH